MTFEIIIWKFIVSFSIFKEEEPQEIKSSILYDVTTDKNGIILRTPRYRPLE